MSRRALISLMTSLLLVAAIGITAVAAEPVLPEGAVLVSGGYADVTGDGSVDQVYLISKRFQADSDFMSEHGLFIIEGKDGVQLLHWLGPESGGYPGTLEFGNLNPGKSMDMLINLPSGGSGGITTAMPVTAEGGKVKVLADLYALNDGPAVEMIVGDKYKLIAKYDGIEYTIDLLKGATIDSAGTYKGIFDEQGRKVGTIKPVIDPVSATEMRDVNNDGVSELVTYRAVWAVFHANTVGIARSVWGWEQDGIKTRFASVKPVFTPEDYAKIVSGITASDPVEALKLAYERYVSSFEAAPPAWRSEAFRVYRSYVYAVCAKVTEALPASNADEATMQKVYQMSDKLSAVGAGIFYVGEGTLAAIPDPKFQLARFEKHIQKDAVEFLMLEAVEVYDIWAMDGALMIQQEEIGNRLHDWEFFLLSHPGSSFEQYAMQQYVSKMAAFLLGVDNSPNFNYTDGSMNPGVIASLEKYVREYGNLPSAGTIAQAIGIMREGNGKLNQDKIDRILKLLPQPVSKEESTTK